MQTKLICWTCFQNWSRSNRYNMNGWELQELAVELKRLTECEFCVCPQGWVKNWAGWFIFREVEGEF